MQEGGIFTVFPLLLDNHSFKDQPVHGQEVDTKSIILANYTLPPYTYTTTMANLSIPHCTENVLKNLYHVKEALRREAFMEAVDYIGEALTQVKNEQDWTYRTDPELDIIEEYLNNLAYTVYNINQVDISKRDKITAIIIAEIGNLTEKMSHAMKGHDVEDAPDPHLDVIEIAHRNRIYKDNDDSS